MDCPFRVRDHRGATSEGVALGYDGRSLSGSLRRADSEILAAMPADSFKEFVLDQLSSLTGGDVESLNR